MKALKKYSPFAITVLILIMLYSIPRTINYEWLGLVFLFVGIILLFEYFEKSRPDRIKKWNVKRPNKIIHILKYSLLFGLTISLIITFLIHKKAELLNIILIIYLPMIVVFGWIGLLDWQYCNKEFLEKKFKVNL